ncbi:metalloendopeptidase, partial [Nephila pilipes]
MLWKILVAIATFFSRPFHGPEQPFEISLTGPKSWKEATIAMKALHNEEGDMRFSPEYRHGAGIKNETFRWRNKGTGKAEIPYYIHPSIQNLAPLIKKAIDQYHKLTCLRFVERGQKHTDYVYMFKDSG